jgi:hypothetical protein
MIMKRLINLALLIVTLPILYSQVPQTFNYQEVLRNTDGTVIANESVTVRIDILKEMVDGQVAYSESHNAISSSEGLVTLEIGNGTTDTYPIRAIRSF